MRQEQIKRRTRATQTRTGGDDSDPSIPTETNQKSASVSASAAQTLDRITRETDQS